jgi:hypothetical protein
MYHARHDWMLTSVHIFGSEIPFSIVVINSAEILFRAHVPIAREATAAPLFHDMPVIQTNIRAAKIVAPHVASV